jgi:hypothetical protein
MQRRVIGWGVAIKSRKTGSVVYQLFSQNDPQAWWTPNYAEKEGVRTEDVDSHERARREAKATEARFPGLVETMLFPVYEP